MWKCATPDGLPTENPYSNPTPKRKRHEKPELADDSTDRPDGNLSTSGRDPADFSDRYSAFVETLRARCMDFEEGDFDAPADAVSYKADFNGDGITDPIIEESRFACSSSATMFSGGTGGGNIHIFVSQPGGSYDQFEFLGDGLMIVSPQTRPDRPILLLSVHGSDCDVTAEPCYASYVWSQEGRFVSIYGSVAASE